MVIFKGLKNVPKCYVRNNIFLAASKSGSMNKDLMFQWLENIYKSRVPYIVTKKSLLLMDNHRAHYSLIVLSACARMNTTVKLIPAMNQFVSADIGCGC
jgi:hypothetical protein